MKNPCSSVFICGYFLKKFLFAVLILLQITVSATDLYAGKKKKLQNKEVKKENFTNVQDVIQFNEDKTLRQLKHEAINNVIAKALKRYGITVNMVNVVTRALHQEGSRSNQRAAFSTLLISNDFFWYKYEDVQWHVELSELTRLPVELMATIPQLTVYKPEGQREEGFNIDLSLDKVQYVHKDKLKFTVSATKDCYFILFTFDEDDIIVLYPSAWREYNQKLIAGNEEDLNHGFTIENDPGEVAGIRYFYAVGLLKKVSLPEGGENLGGGVLKYDKGIPFLLEWLGKSMPLRNWIGSQQVVTVRRPDDQQYNQTIQKKEHLPGGNP